LSCRQGDGTTEEQAQEKYGDAWHSVAVVCCSNLLHIKSEILGVYIKLPLGHVSESRVASS